MVGIFVLATAALSGQAETTSTHPQEVEQRLSHLVGDWTIAGEEATYRETCEWYANRSFVVCSSSDSSDGSKSQSVLGYSSIEARYTYQNFGSGGTSNTRFGYPLGEDGLVYTLERKNSAGYVRVTTFVTPQSDGRLHFREERSVNGSPWTETANFYYVRRK
ncbi:hypothetical protein [Qipengyuania soli]|uniref:DUF1579 domain-containing protein n=1 Tax=Qipengyuania soli TaxID=2782568 RepID=A0A7S8F2X1_9SPHN|nr:hypothetical protein [Qipengyuania soli]QPC98157.1 hypothetical protein IRL76_09750 [Qipengyuania soli]